MAALRPTNSGEHCEGAGGTFGRLTLLNTASYQEPGLSLKGGGGAS